MDPATGGVLAFISKPGYDPNLFIDGIDSQSWKDLNDDWKNRWSTAPCAACIRPAPPSSPSWPWRRWKPSSATPTTPFPTQGISLPGSTHRFRDSKPSGWGSMNMFRSIQVSSDTYYYKLAWDMGIDRLEPQLASSALAALPASIWMARHAGVAQQGMEAQTLCRQTLPRGRTRAWTPADVVPIGIGQGYNTYTPLQVAHAVAILANNGVVYRPHVVKEIENLKTGEITKVEPNRCATIIPTRPISPL